MKRRIICRFCLVALAGVLWLGQPVSGQQEKEDTLKERVRTSVKGLKWDKKQGRAVEKGTKSEKKSPAQAGKRQGSELLVRTELVNLGLTVITQNGRLLSSLNRNDFEIHEDKVRQEAAFFHQWSDVNTGLSLILIVDLSGRYGLWTRSPKYFQFFGAEALVDLLGPKDEMAIVTADVRLICDYTGDKAKLREHLRDLEEERLLPYFRQTIGSEQIDALVSSLREMMRTEHAHPVIIWQSDGDQVCDLRDAVCGKRLYNVLTVMNGGLFPKDFPYATTDVLRWVQASPARIYSIITAPKVVNQTDEKLFELGTMFWGVPYGEGVVSEREARDRVYKMELESVRFFDWRFLFGQMQSFMERVATESGGWAAYLDQPESAAQIYQRILDDARQRYILAYYPTNTARDGKWREVKVTVKGHPEYIVRGRKGYYAAKD